MNPSERSRTNLDASEELESLVDLDDVGELDALGELEAAPWEHADDEPEGPTSLDPVPAGLRDFVRSICRRAWVVNEVLAQAESVVLRRMRTRTAEGIAERWRKRWEPRNVPETKRLLCRLRDRVLRRHHEDQLAEHARFAQLPDALRAWRPNRDGELVVTDFQIPTPSIGVPSFLEQTAPKVLRWVFETFRQRRQQRSPSLGSTRRHPRVWDLTAGSGTSLDLLGLIHRCEVIASDLTVVAGTGIAFGDCRDVGRLPVHRALGGLSAPAMPRRRPDIVLFDPPSRGRPTHADLYQVGPAPSSDDLGELDREAYVVAVAVTIVEATRALAPGGFVSVLLRCGSRRRGEVIPDPELLPFLKAALDGFVNVTHEMPIVYRSPRSQAALGTARVPSVHLCIERFG